MTKRGEAVGIPLKSRPPPEIDLGGGILEDVRGLDPRPGPRDPREDLRHRARELGVPEALFPTRWERIGDVVIVRLRDDARPHAPSIGQAFAEALHARAVAEDVSGIHGVFRTPDLRMLWGEGTETLHVQDGVRFRLDAARVMFSSGNLPERLRVARRVRPRDVVVDLFAGIGYFALPIASRVPSSRVHACELNPVAYAYLEENVRLNRLANVTTAFGDCRETAPVGVADWVLLGHFDSLERIDVGVRCLRDRGTLVVHQTCLREEFPRAVEGRVSHAVEGMGGRVHAIVARRVKSYAPGIGHVVVEVDAEAPKGISAGSSSPPAVLP